MRAMSRLVVGSLLGAVALGGCGGSGSGSATDQIRATIIASVRLPDKGTCTSAFTDAGIKAYYSQDTAAAGRRDCANEVGRAVNQARVKQLKISGISISGDTATANAELNGRRAAYSLVRQGGGWKVNNIRAASQSAGTSSSSSTAAATTASSSASVNTDRLDLEIAARAYNAAAHRFASRVRADAAAKSLDAVKGDASQFRDAVFTFDASVRKIKPGAAAGSAYNSLLASDRTTIADLDAVGSAPTPAEVGRLFRGRLVPDTQTLVAAENRLYGLL